MRKHSSTASIPAMDTENSSFRYIYNIHQKIISKDFIKNQENSASKRIPCPFFHYISQVGRSNREIPGLTLTHKLVKSNNHATVSCNFHSNPSTGPPGLLSLLYRITLYSPLQRCHSWIAQVSDHLQQNVQHQFECFLPLN